MHTVQQIKQSASVITVLNLKGGVGKTHTTWLLASVAEERGLRVLLIDTDPQGNLSNSFLREREGVAGVERLLDPSQDADGLSLVQRRQTAHCYRMVVQEGFWRLPRPIMPPSPFRTSCGQGRPCAEQCADSIP